MGAHEMSLPPSARHERMHGAGLGAEGATVRLLVGFRCAGGLATV